MTSPAEEIARYRDLVDVDNYDLTVRELVRMVVEGEVVRAPEYQRKFRWTNADESKLIESMWIGLPVPSIYVAVNIKDGTWDLVDGLQRVSTLVHYLVEDAGQLAKLSRDAPLKLEGLTKLPSLNGKRFTDLPKSLRLLFTKRLLRVTSLSEKSDADIRFELFERLNSGGVNLTNQEVRACVYRGPLMDFLKKEAENEDFNTLLKLQRKDVDNGTKEELVLKFIAYLKEREQFKDDVKGFLNDFAKRHQEEAPEEWRDEFRRAVAALRQLLNDNPIKRSTSKTSPLNLVEAVLIGAAEAIAAGDDLKELGDLKWLDDDDLAKHTTAGTNTKAHLNGRIERARELLS